MIRKAKKSERTRLNDFLKGFINEEILVMTTYDEPSKNAE